MHAGKNAMVAIIASLATTTTAITGAASLAHAADKDNSAQPNVSTKVVHTSKTLTGTKTEALQVEVKSVPRKAAAHKIGAAAGAATSSCYTYTNGTGDFCSWYRANQGQSRAGVYGDDDNLWDNYFVTAGYGQGQTIANNAEYVWNLDGTYTAHPATSTGYYGNYGTVYPNQKGNYTNTYKNNVESLKWS
jgi:hypothetical protein